MRRAIRSLFFMAVLAVGSSPAMAQSVPIVTDSRIKTFVYNPNEVFTITTHYGYQSNIEFGEKETIDTVSVGDRVAWQIIPAGRRLFIRAMEENAHTNMTIVTNLRAYQFDLRSSSADAVFGSEELTYVVRFFYPGDAGYDTALRDTELAPAPAPELATAMPVAPPAATVSVAPPRAAAPAVAIAVPKPVDTGSIPASPTPRIPGVTVRLPAGQLNYRYTYSGPSMAAPVKIYDDGKSTYFKYRNATAPRVAVITTKGERIAVPTRTVDGQTVAVDVVAPRFSLNQPGGEVIVYNESQGS